jgi:hypothetical protein
MALHEVGCFARTLGVPTERITSYSLLQGAPDARLLANHDALLVGGSGDYSVLGKEPFRALSWPGGATSSVTKRAPRSAPLR